MLVLSNYVKSWRVNFIYLWFWPNIVYRYYKIQLRTIQQSKTKLNYFTAFAAISIASNLIAPIKFNGPFPSMAHIYQVYTL